MIDKLDQVGCQLGGLPQAAYTITINQNSAAIDESTGLTVNDQDTEKTKFWKKCCQRQRLKWIHGQGE